MTIAENISRMVLRSIILAGQENDLQTLSVFGVTLEDAKALRDLSPVDLENIIRTKRNLVNVTINRKTLIKTSRHRQTRRESRSRELDLLKRLVVAQCPNEILREHFGILPKDASKLRRTLNIQYEGRPRALSEGEEQEIYRLLHTGAYDLAQPNGVLECCLSIHSLTEAPFKRIYTIVCEEVGNVTH